jgi:hypothetical protein
MRGAMQSPFYHDVETKNKQESVVRRMIGV